MLVEASTQHLFGSCSLKVAPREILHYMHVSLYLVFDARSHTLACPTRAWALCESRVTTLVDPHVVNHLLVAAAGHGVHKTLIGI